MEKQIDFKETNKSAPGLERTPDKEMKSDLSLPHRNIIFKTIAQLKLTDHAFALEIGFKDTKHLSVLFQKVKGIGYYGNNISEALVQEASTDQTLKINEGHAQFIQAKTDGKLDFGNDFFDCCFTVNTIYFWEDPIEYLKEIHRVLQPGGKLNLAFTEKQFGRDLPWTQGDFTFYELNEVKTFFRKTGFANFEVKQMTEELIGKDGKEMSRPFVIVTGMK